MTETTKVERCASCECRRESDIHAMHIPQLKGMTHEFVPKKPVISIEYLQQLATVFDSEIKFRRKQLAGRKPDDQQRGFFKGLRQGKRFVEMAIKLKARNHD